VPNLDVNKYAQIGARVRLAELQSEIDTIHAAFPELRDGASPARRRGRPSKQSQAAATAGDAPQRRRKRRGMSAAKRREVSERMKKYWAQRRKAAKSA
jgi:hypothetical protein